MLNLSASGSPDPRGASSRNGSSPKRRRILQVITTVDVGGAEHHLLSLCRGLVDLGHEVDVVFLKGRGTLEARFQDLGIRTRRLETERWGGYLRAAWGLWRLCRRGRYDLVHTHLLKANVLGALAARGAGVETVIASKHNDEHQLRHPVIAWIHRHLSKLDTRVLHASRHIADYMIEVGGVDAEKSRVVHYGVDAERLAAGPGLGIRSERGLSNQTFILTCVARLIRRKGHLQLLDAFAKVLSDGNNDGNKTMELWLVGDGPMADEIRERIHTLGLEDRVWMAGERLDVSSILKESDAFTLASTHEGLGLVLLEAMACRLPVLATEAGGMPELVQDGITGRLVPVDDPEALAAAVYELASHPERREQWGEAGYRRLQGELCHRRMMSKIVETYGFSSDESPPSPLAEPSEVEPPAVCQEIPVSPGSLSSTVTASSAVASPKPTSG